jgi:hypothetical protein
MKLLCYNDELLSGDHHWWRQVEAPSLSKVLKQNGSELFETGERQKARKLDPH